MSTDRKHRQRDEASRERERSRVGDVSQRTALISVVVRTLLVVLKYFFAVLSGSVALMAEAVRNVPDIVQSLALYLGIRISGRKSAQFPYGLYKLENLISLGVAILITLVGYELARNVIVGRTAPEIQNLPWTIAAMFVAAGISLGFSIWEGRIAARTGSPALRADSRDALIDTLTTGAVLISLGAAWFGYNIDLWAALLIVLFIAYTAWDLGADAVRVLLDASIERGLLDDIREVIESDPDVLEVHDLMGRNSGPYRFVEAHVVLDVHELDQAHQISYRLEAAVHEAAPDVDTVLIHFEPEHRDTYLYAAPVEAGDRLSPQFGEATRYAIVTVGSEDRLVRDVRYIENPYTGDPSGRGIRIAQMLIREDVDAVFTRENIKNKGPYYVLTAEHIAVIETDAETLPDALRQERLPLEVPADANGPS